MLSCQIMAPVVALSVGLGACVCSVHEIAEVDSDMTSARDECCTAAYTPYSRLYSRLGHVFCIWSALLRVVLRLEMLLAACIANHSCVIYYGRLVGLSWMSCGSGTVSFARRLVHFCQAGAMLFHVLCAKTSAVLMRCCRFSLEHKRLCLETAHCASELSSFVVHF